MFNQTLLYRTKQYNISLDIISKEKDIMKGNMIREKIILKSKGANFFGQESKGVAQIRGNGTLILYETFLYFKQFITKKEILIPIKNIKTIEITKSHLKKTKFRPLLKVIYTNDMGKEDSVAWLVNKLDLWVSTLEQKLT